MSYTNGGQTINKSMNGIITFDTGGGVVIEGGDVTATGVTADNIVCDTLQVNTSATFAGTSTFDDNLPTSVITSTTSDDQFITKAIGDTLYAGGGILADNNVWTGQNSYNTYLPTSNITSTTSTTQIAPISILDTLYARLATGVTNTWLSSNVFDAILPTSTITTTTSTNQIAPIAVLNNLYGRLGIANTWSARNTFSSGITVATDVSCNSINCSSQSNFGSSIIVAGAVVCDGCQICPQMTMQIRGFDSTGQYVFTNAGVTTPKYIFGFDYFSNSDRLIIEPLLSTFYNVLKIKSSATTTTAASALVIENTEVSPSQINFLLNAVASTANPNVTAGDDVIYSNGGVLNLTTSSATAVGIRMSQTDIQTRANTTTLTGTTLNNDITTTNINSTTLAISGSTTTTFVNLPSTTTTFTTATANQFITKSIGDALYPAVPTGGYARLTTVANTFTNANTFNAGANNTLFYGSGAVILSTSNNVAETPTAGATSTPAFRIRNFNTDTQAIKFIPLATVDALNTITEASDSVISGHSVLTLTAEGATEVGIRIADTGAITIKAGTITTASTSYTLFTGNAGIMRTSNNLAENTVAGATATPAFRVRDYNGDTKTIKFIPNATVGALNPAVLVNNSVISADSVLTLTADGATTSGIRIADTGVVTVVGTTNTLSSTTTSITGTTLTVSASTSSTFNSFVTFNTQVPIINVDATGASTKEAVNWAVVTSRLATTVSNLLGGINTWTQSNTFNSSVSMLEPFIYNFAAAKTYANTGSVGYSLNNATRLVATVGTTYTNVASINLPAAYGMWLIEFECDFNTTTDAFYQMGLTTTTGGTPTTHSKTEAYARAASSAMVLQSQLLFKNTALNQTVYGVIRGTPASTAINTVAIRFTRLG